MMSILALENGFVPATALAAVPLLLLVAYLVANPVSMDPKEPPLVHARIPLVGHVIGILQHSWQYLDMIYAKYPVPILTLPMLSGKVYVVNDPELAQAALRNRSLSFDPFLRDLVKGMANTSAETMKTWDDPAFYGRWVKILYGGMAGQSLLGLNISAVGKVAASMNEIGDDVVVENLYRWNRQMFTLASTDSLYGSMNPMRADRRLIDAYWDYETDVHKLMVGIFPSLIAPRGHRGQKLVERAFQYFFDSNLHEGADVPSLVKERRKLSKSFGMPSSAAAAIELLFLHGAISNTFPTFYWFFTRVFNQPALIARLRKEVQGIIEETGFTTTDGKRKRVATLHIEKIEEKCQLLMSCFRETHRLYASGILARKVMADTTISDGKTSYVLKKDWQVQGPQTILHLSPHIWGDDALEFVGDRFLKMAEEKGEAVVNFAPRGFLGFGGGKHIW
ncbi:prostacyclin synthase [Colletotrichum incanum]|nr:prostacyclin synthase [Colletotrichum incanum]